MGQFAEKLLLYMRQVGSYQPRPYPMVVSPTASCPACGRPLANTANGPFVKP